MNKLLKKSWIVCLAAMTAACVGSTETDQCTIFVPIYGSKNDTQLTRQQVDQHNARGIGACGWGPMKTGGVI
jgi:hypothetical protein